MASTAPGSRLAAMSAFSTFPISARRCDDRQTASGRTRGNGSPGCAATTRPGACGAAPFGDCAAIGTTRHTTDTASNHTLIRTLLSRGRAASEIHRASYPGEPVQRVRILDEDAVPQTLVWCPLQ